MTEYKIENITWAIDTGEPSPFDEPLNGESAEQDQLALEADEMEDGSIEDEFRWQSQVAQDLATAVSDYLSFNTPDALFSYITKLIN